jgi:hypothetical protein
MDIEVTKGTQLYLDIEDNDGSQQYLDIENTEAYSYVPGH